MPSVDDVVRAVQESDATTVQPPGAYAANLLGLSTQVPMRVELYTNGPRKVIRYGRQQILLKPTTPRNMAAASTQEVHLVLRRARLKYQQHKDKVLLDKVYGYIQEYY